MHEALTAVKNAVRGSVNLPLCDDMGSIRSIAPTAMRIKKPTAMTAVIFLLDFFSFLRISSRI
jgi:hypothetical protein